MTTLPPGVTRCPGSGSHEDGQQHWREVGGQGDD